MKYFILWSWTSCLLLLRKLEKAQALKHFGKTVDLLELSLIDQLRIKRKHVIIISVRSVTNHLALKPRARPIEKSVKIQYRNNYKNNNFNLFFYHDAFNSLDQKTDISS